MISPYPHLPRTRLLEGSLLVGLIGEGVFITAQKRRGSKNVRLPCSSKGDQQGEWEAGNRNNITLKAKGK